MVDGLDGVGRALDGLTRTVSSLVTRTCLGEAPDDIAHLAGRAALPTGMLDQRECGGCRTPGDPVRTGGRCLEGRW